MMSRSGNFLFVALALAAGGVWAEAGRIQFVAGPVTLTPVGGSPRPAVKGDRVEEGDLVTTAPGAAAQLRMADDGLIALRSDSSLRIDTYRFRGQAAGQEKGILALIRGGFRTITGLLGRVRKDALVLRTPTATIGIRGTDHEPTYIPEGGWSGAPGAEPGTYDKVNDGATYLETAAGRIELAANEVGFVPPRTDAAPLRLPAVPAFMRAAPLPQGRPDVRGLRQEAAADEAVAEVRPRAQRLPLQADPTRLATPAPASGAAIAGGGLSPAPRGLAVAGADQYLGTHVPGSGAGVNQPEGLTVLRDGTGQIGVIGAAGGFRYSRGDARLVQGGSVTIMDGTTQVPVRWGIYGGGHIVDNMGERLPRFMSVVGALAATSDAQLTALSGLGSRTFSLLAASQPTNSLGQIGGRVETATVTVDFANLSVTDARLRVGDAQGYGFEGVAKVPVTLNRFADSGVNLAVGLTTPKGVALPTEPGMGHLHGVLVGPGGKGLIGGYDMNYALPDGPRSVAGVVVLQR